MSRLFARRLSTACSVALISVLYTSAPSAAASSFDLREIANYARGADLSKLTDLQVNELTDIIYTKDHGSNTGAMVRAYLLHINGGSLLQKLFN